MCIRDRYNEHTKQEAAKENTVVVGMWPLGDEKHYRNRRPANDNLQQVDDLTVLLETVKKQTDSNGCIERGTDVRADPPQAAERLNGVSSFVFVGFSVDDETNSGNTYPH
eukprot:TRINITY_DN15996_c0_g1_i1.p2 TRINITY_DN15996_c0_g1~~TRINITY_DN15996_c0_g1_i1.p2  ORF type:complete len:110 (+),score=19.09 TRINITY_DN15996_c0_g1_i1:179-508(+)